MLRTRFRFAVPNAIRIGVFFGGLALAFPVLAESPAPTLEPALDGAAALVDAVGKNIFTLIAGVIVLVLAYGVQRWNLSSNYKLLMVAIVVGLVGAQLYATYNSDKGQREADLTKLRIQVAAEYDSRLRVCQSTLRQLRELIVGKLEHPDNIEVVKALAGIMLEDVDSATECIDLQTASPSPGASAPSVTSAPASDVPATEPVSSPVASP